MRVFGIFQMSTTSVHVKASPAAAVATLLVITSALFKMPVGSAPVPEPSMQTRSISVAIVARRSSRTTCSMLGEVLSNALRLMSVKVPKVLPVKVT
uniref:Putative Major capsid protein HK97 n=1 Tax=uncultured marine virus TaxID=186617 RepID=A0A0F7L2T9_9VIRU|nr:putative Major capsid protein HK97 [uncultured marine virus]